MLILTVMQFSPLRRVFILLYRGLHFQLFTLALYGAEDDFRGDIEILCIAKIFDTLANRRNGTTHASLVSRNVLILIIRMRAACNGAVTNVAIKTLFILRLHDCFT